MLIMNIDLSLLSGYAESVIEQVEKLIVENKPKIYLMSLNIPNE